MKWLLNNWDQVLVALGQHIVIAFTSIAIAFVLSLAIGIWAARREAVFRSALTVTGLLYTVPTLAFLALLIPVVGLGKANAIICMVAFSLMIMIRNVAVGIREVPHEVARMRSLHGSDPFRRKHRAEDHRGNGFVPPLRTREPGHRPR